MSHNFLDETCMESVLACLRQAGNRQQIKLGFDLPKFIPYAQWLGLFPELASLLCTILRMPQRLEGACQLPAGSCAEALQMLADGMLDRHSEFLNGWDKPWQRCQEPAF